MEHCNHLRAQWCQECGYTDWSYGDVYETYPEQSELAIETLMFTYKLFFNSKHTESTQIYVQLYRSEK